jgi:hypothetical protein
LSSSGNLYRYSQTTGCDLATHFGIYLDKVTKERPTLLKAEREFDSCQELGAKLIILNMDTKLGEGKLALINWLYKIIHKLQHYTCYPDNSKHIESFWL